MFGKMKDKALTAGAKMAVNSKIKGYGEMLKLNLDSKNRCIEIEVMLDGEKETLEVTVERYELSEEDGKNFLKLHGIKTSRAWIDVVTASYLEGRAFEIPAEYVKMLKIVI
ncbi:MAG: hypothetical protein B5M52_03925 [Helicobacteraceae bacterium 4484_230]|nr:MAG: hypothetical protein B5M52_03925 [Helicobacteraceae bacterium 4484_230]